MNFFIRYPSPTALPGINPLSAAIAACLLAACLLATPLQASAATSQGEREPTIIKLGEIIVLPAPRAAKITLPKGKFVSARDRGAKVELRGLKAGEGRVNLGAKSSTILVVSPHQYRCLERFKEISNLFEGIELVSHYDHIEITGELWSVADWKTIFRMSESLGCPLKFGAFIPANLQLQAKGFIDSILKDQVEAYTLSFASWPAMRVRKPLSPTQALKVSSLGLKVEVSPNSSSGEATQVDLLLAEVSAHRTQELGLSWSNTFSLQVLPEKAWAGSISALAQFLSQSGTGSVLAQPTISVGPSETAEFLQGGEIPILQSAFRRQTTEWKKYGLSIRVRPRWLENSRSELEIETELSSPDFSSSINGVPSLKIQKFSSRLEAPENQWFLLNSLVRNDEGQSHQGFPGTDNLPLLRHLFGSTRRSHADAMGLILARVSRR